MGGDINDIFYRLCKKANIEVMKSKSVNKSCCGQIFSSKGFANAHDYTINKTIETLYNASNQGKIPIVLDVTSCTQTIINGRHYLSRENQKKFDQMKILDVIDFAYDILIPAISISSPKEKIVFHPVCSVHKMGTMTKLQ